jgi:hypothetical protein
VSGDDGQRFADRTLPLGLHRHADQTSRLTFDIAGMPTHSL